MKLSKLFIILACFVLSGCKGGSKLISKKKSCEDNNEENSILIESKSIIGDLEWTHHIDITDQFERKNMMAVGKLFLPAKYSACTAFLINTNTIMTNHHCVRNTKNAMNASFRLRNEKGEKESYLCEKLLLTNSSLDFSLLECDGTPGLKYGHLPLGDEELSIYDPIYLIQENCHYTADPSCVIDKYLARGEIKKFTDFILGHNADTLGGSSGSPIFSGRDNQLVGIHNAGQIDPDPVTGSNFGVPMFKIKAYIKDYAPEIKIDDFDAFIPPRSNDPQRPVVTDCA